MRHHLTTAMLASVCVLAFSPAIGAETGVGLTAGQGVARVDAAQKGSLQLSTEQRQSVIDAVAQLDTHQPTPKEFKAAEGESIPPTLFVHALPQPLTEKLPVLKEYMYAHLDREIAIIDAHAKKVALLIALPENLVMTGKKPDVKAAGENAVGGLPGLSDEQRRAIYQAANGAPQPVPAGEALRADLRAPAALTTQPLPPEAAAQASQLQGLSYAKLQDGRLLLIDPKDSKIAGVITKDEGTKVAKEGGNSNTGTGANGKSADPEREREETGKPSAYTGPRSMGPNSDAK
jgi:hypothetical protein